MKNENTYQGELIDTIKDRFPRCIVFKNDPNYIQGIPDLLIVKNDQWAALEVKREARAPHRPNQDFYVGIMNGYSFARFIYPENENEVLDDLERFFRP